MGKVVRAVVGIGLIVAGVFMGGSTWPLAVMALGGGIAASALQPKMDMPAVSSASEGRLHKSLEPEEYRKIAFGRTALGTDTRYWEVHGRDQEQMDEVLALAGHKITSFDALYVEDELVSFDGSGNAIGKYAGALSMSVSLEGLSGTAMAGIGAGARWNASGGEAASMTGIAHLGLKWTWSREKLPRGFPTRITPVGKGAPVYDPRRDSTRGGSGTHRAEDQSTWEYLPTDSNGQPIGRNTALQILHYIIGWRVQNPSSAESVLVHGMGEDLDDIDFDLFIQAANDCETEGYYSDCLLSTGDSHATNIAVLEQACAGRVSDAGGRYGLRIQVDDFGGALTTFTDDDIVGESDWRPEMPLSQSDYNQIAGQFIDPDALYQLRALPLVRDAAYEAADGKKRRTNIRLDAVQDGAQGQKLLRLMLNKSRRKGIFEAPFGWRAVNVKVGQPVKLTLSRFGFSERYFRVRAQKIDPGGAVWMALEDDDPSVYTPGTVAPVPAAVPGAGYDPLAVPTQPDPDVYTPSPKPAPNRNPGIIIDAPEPAPGPHPRIVIDWRPVNDPDTGLPWAGAEDGWRVAANVESSTTRVEIGGLEPLTDYETGVRYISEFGIIGARRVLAPVTTGPLDATQVGVWTEPALDALEDAVTALDADLATAEAQIERGRRAFDAGAADFGEAARSAADTLDAALAETAARLAELQSAGAHALDENALRKTEIKTLEVRTDSAEASITTLQDSVVDLEANKAEATDLTALEARVTTNEGEIATNAASIVSLSNVQAETDRVSAEQYERLLAELAGQTVEALQGVRVSIDANEAAITRVASLELSVGTNDGGGTLFGRIATSESLIADLETGKVDVSTFNALEALVGTDDGQGALIGRVGTLETVTADLDANKVEVTTFNLLEARVTTNESETDANTASISTLDAAVAEGDRVSAERYEQFLAEIAASLAQAVQGVSVRADENLVAAERIAELRVDVGTPDGSGALFARVGSAESAIVDLDATKAEASALTALESRVTTNEGDIATAESNITTLFSTTADLEANKAEATALTALEATVNDNTSNITVNANAIADLEGATAYYTIVVAASGSNPAIATLSAGQGGSAVSLAADQIALANMGAGENEYLPVLEAVGGEAFFAQPIHVNDGAATPTKRVIVGPGNGWVFWYGDADKTAGTATVANADFAFDASGRRYIKGQSATAGAGTSVGAQSANIFVCVARLDLSGVEAINEFGFAGTDIVFQDPAASGGNTSDIETWDVRFIVADRTQINLAVGGTFDISDTSKAPHFEHIVSPSDPSALDFQIEKISASAWGARNYKLKNRLRSAVMPFGNNSTAYILVSKSGGNMTAKIDAATVIRATPITNQPVL